MKNEKLTFKSVKFLQKYISHCLYLEGVFPFSIRLDIATDKLSNMAPINKYKATLRRNLNKWKSKHILFFITNKFILFYYK